jgi:hypothetical protein
MSHRSGLSSPFHSPHPLPDPDGDKRDIHDHNPSTNLGEAHERGAGDPKNDFIEGVASHPGSRLGHTAEVVPNILSTAMGGQRRSATGEYESEPSIHKTQAVEQRENEERRQAGFPYNPHQEGRE